MFKTSNVIFVFCLLMIPAAARAKEYQCPAKIDTAQSLTQSFDGWSSYQDTVNGVQNLKGIQVYDGPPEELASLIPDNEEAGKQEEKSFWTFNVQNGRAIWIACEYYQSTVALTRELPLGVEKCTLIAKDIISCK